MRGKNGAGLGCGGSRSCTVEEGELTQKDL